MTNEITTQSFRVSRTTKAGKQTYRDMEDTMLSGNSAERIAATTWLVNEDWAKGDMGATVTRLVRVFTAKKVQTVVDSINLGLRMMKSEQPPVEIYGASKRDVLAIIQGLMLSEQKGEKAKWLSIFNAVATAEAEREAQKAIRKAQFEADQAKLSAPASGTDAATEAKSELVGEAQPA